LRAALLHRSAAEEGAQQDVPVAPEIDEQRRRRAEMEHDEKRQKGRRLLIDAQRRRQDHGVAQAADGKKLGQTLDDGNDQRVKKVHLLSL
jgi:hypothetical protein